MEKYKRIALIISFLILVICTIALYSCGLIAYFIVFFAFSLVLFILLVTSISLNKSTDEIYDIEVKNILKIYDAILVRTTNYPKIHNRNIINVDSIEDLVDAQLEIRKPIYFIKQDDTCSFILLDATEALVYILRRNKDSKCPLDIDLENFDVKRNKEALHKACKVDNIFDDIENTTVFKLSDTKKFKISPMNKQEEEQLKLQQEQLRLQQEQLRLQQEEQDKLLEQKQLEEEKQKQLLQQKQIEEEKSTLLTNIRDDIKVNINNLIEEEKNKEYENNINMFNSLVEENTKLVDDLEMI